MVNIDFGALLKRYRKQKGMTQKELADAAGVSPSAVNKYETGQRKCSFENAQRFAYALNVSLYDLIVPDNDSYHKAQYAASFQPGAAFDTLLGKVGYAIIFESDAPYLIGKGERFKLTEDLVLDFMEAIDTGLQVQIEILKKKAALLEDPENGEEKD